MKAPTPITLLGDLVRLEPLTVAHAPGLLAAGQYEEIWRWLPWLPPRTVEDMLVQVRSALEDRTRLAFAVTVDGRVVGTTSFGDIDVAVGGVEIGWTWYTPDVWAGRVNPECKLLLLEQAFDVLGAGRVTLKTDVLNVRSQAAIRKLGARYDGTLRHHRLRADGSVRDSVYFSILVAEWPSVRAGLRGRLRKLTAR